jgi:hypothetical protein
MGDVHDLGNIVWQEEGFEEWLETIPEEERRCISLWDAWKAGAGYIIKVLTKTGFIDSSYTSSYTDRARKEEENIYT